MGWKPKSAEGIPGKRHQRRTRGASLKGSGRIFNMLGKYESRWSREVTALHLHFQKVILLHITNDWRGSTPNSKEVPSKSKMSRSTEVFPITLPFATPLVTSPGHPASPSRFLSPRPPGRN